MSYKKLLGTGDTLNFSCSGKKLKKNAFSQKMFQSALVQLSDHLVCADCVLKRAIND